MALFAIMINDVGDQLPTSIGRPLFVDDLAAWYSASSPRLVSRQLAVTRLERLSAKSGLCFSTTKSVVATVAALTPIWGSGCMGNVVPRRPPYHTFATLAVD